MNPTTKKALRSRTDTLAAYIETIYDAIERGDLPRVVQTAHYLDLKTCALKEAARKAHLAEEGHTS